MGNIPEASDIVSHDDSSLVRRCLAGQPEATSELIQRYQSDVFGLCVRLLSHRQDAEDVTQEVFLRIFRSLHTWDSTRPLKPWIVGITVNRCRTWMTQRKKRPELVDHLQESAGREDQDDSTELIDEIRLALEAVRGDYRTVFILFHEQNQSYEEIALSMERPVGTIKTWLHRARAEVLEHLKRRGMISEEESLAN